MRTKIISENLNLEKIDYIKDFRELYKYEEGLIGCAVIEPEIRGSALPRIILRTFIERSKKKDEQNFVIIWRFNNYGKELIIDLISSKSKFHDHIIFKHTIQMLGMQEVPVYITSFFGKKIHKFHTPCMIIKGILSVDALSQISFVNVEPKKGKQEDYFSSLRNVLAAYIANLCGIYTVETNYDKAEVFLMEVLKEMVDCGGKISFYENFLAYILMKDQNHKRYAVFTKRYGIGISVMKTMDNAQNFLDIPHMIIETLKGLTTNINQFSKN